MSLSVLGLPVTGGGGSVNYTTSNYTSGTTVNGKGYALVFPEIGTINKMYHDDIAATQDKEGTISLSIDGISSSYQAYRVFACYQSSNKLELGVSQAIPMTFMFTTSFYATGSFQKIILYLETE